MLSFLMHDLLKHFKPRPPVTFIAKDLYKKLLFMKGFEKKMEIGE